jgi:hypothetical protein
MKESLRKKIKINEKKIQLEGNVRPILGNEVRE